MTRLFRSPRRILTGSGCIAQVGVEAANMGLRRPLIVTSPQVDEAGHVHHLQDILKRASIDATIFRGIDSEPTTNHVEAGYAAFVDSGADGVISIGGGSCLDAGKGIAVRVRNPGPMSRYEGTDRIEGGRVPHIGISTTAGTGSEVTRFAVFTDMSRNVKMLSTSDDFMPDLAVDDPDLTMSSPPAVTAAAGIDALTHAIEAYVSRHAQPLSDALAISAIRLISGALPTVVADGSNRTARAAMMDGSLHAGLAFSNSSVALAHGMARPLGANFPIPHGAATGILLPHAMEYSLASAVERYANIGTALGATVHGQDSLARAHAAVDHVRSLCQRIRVSRLGQFGVTEQGLRAHGRHMAEDALASGSPANNPRVPTIDEIVDLYHRAL